MNKTTILVLIVGIALLIITSLYFSPVMMPFGMETEDIEKHITGDEHNESDHNYVVGHNDDVVEDYEISPGNAVKRMQSGEDVIVLDVRTLEEYKEIHLKNALLLPVQELSAKSLNKIGLGEDAKDKEIIIYYRSGTQSQVAYNIMKSLGYTNIKSVAGGMIHWEESGYPLTETGVYTGPSASNNTTNTEDNKDGARISFNRTFYDFGAIPQYGGIVKTDFTITNGGTEVLEIGEITTSCSCTSATISDRSIEPGNEATLTVIFDPDFHAEPLDVFKRTVFIPNNDSNTPEAEVSVQMDILEGV